jgi:uncharacterized membrane protein YdbT with pleckstrin-like domain
LEPEGGGSMANRSESTVISDHKNTNHQDRSHSNSGVEKPLLKVRPSWWNYFWYLVFCWLIIPLLIALWKRGGLLLSIYEDKIVLERGILSKSLTQILISDIRSVDTRQSFGQRIFKVGDILISTAAMAGYEIVAMGLPDPRGIAALVMRQRQFVKGN